MRTLRAIRRVEYFFSPSLSPDVLNLFSGAYDSPDPANHPDVVRRTFYDWPFKESRYRDRCVVANGSVALASFFSREKPWRGMWHHPVDTYLRALLPGQTLCRPDHLIEVAWIVTSDPASTRVIDLPVGQSMTPAKWTRIEQLAQDAGIEVGCLCHYDRHHAQHEGIAIPPGESPAALDHFRVLLVLEGIRSD